jgi:hypothetical protein
MFWTVVERSVNLVFLLLAIIIISILLSNNTNTIKSDNILAKFDLYKQEQMKVMSNNVQYLETRQNRQAEQQDSYQNGTDSRLRIIEERIKWYEADKRQNSKVIQTNINNNTNN